MPQQRQLRIHERSTLGLTMDILPTADPIKSEKGILSQDLGEVDTSHLIVDEAAERRLVQKLDTHIVWIVMLLYLLSFLDRVNIGNARLFGLEEVGHPPHYGLIYRVDNLQDLHMTGNDYQTAVSLLFVTYLLSEVPSNLVIKKLRPSRWISFIATSWGIIATLTGVCQSYGGLIACRLLLGVMEGGLFPGMTIYLTLFYTKKELALRVGYLFVAAALAGAFGGLLAYAIGNMDGVAGQRAWRWIMIIEGLPTFVLGIATWWLLADNPETAYYLGPEEKELMRLRRAREVGQTTSAQEFHWYDVRKAFTDWKVWAFSFAQFGVDTMLYGYSTFLPTIIKGINPRFSSALVQVLTIPCYALGAVTFLISAYFSDKMQKRAVFPVILGCIAIAGYGMLMSNAGSATRYAGCYLVATGLYVSVGIPLAWLPVNNPRYGKRTTASGMQLTIGNSAGIMSPFVSSHKFRR